MPEPKQRPEELTVDHHRHSASDCTVADPLTSVHNPAVAIDPDWPQPDGYQVVGLIAEGGMGRVYEGFDLVLQRSVAIKTLRSSQYAERFVTEARITAQLPHPCIPPVHALGTLPDGRPYLVMKRIRGQTLAERLRSRGSSRENISSDIQIFEHIAQAVGFAHAQGVLHRDLKPSNIMLGEFGEVQVMDWGLAKQTQQAAPQATGEEPHADLQTAKAEPDQLCPPFDPVDQTASGVILGTPGYMSPEQARGEVVDARSDVFALGSLLCTILTGQPAISGRDRAIERTGRAELADAQRRLSQCGADAELITLARACLAERPEDRPRDAQEVAHRVAAYRATVEQRLQQAQTALVREGERRTRRRLLLSAGLALVLTLSVGLGISLWQRDRALKAENRALAERDSKSQALEMTKQTLSLLTEDLVAQHMQKDTTLSPEWRAYLETIANRYETLSKLSGDNQEARLLRAEGLTRLAKLRFQLGQLAQAAWAYEQADALLRSLLEELPERIDLQREQAKLLCNRAILDSIQNHTQQSYDLFQKAIELQLRFFNNNRTDIEWLHDLAHTYENMGNLEWKQGKLKQAESAYQQALDCWKRFIEQTTLPHAAQDRQASVRLNLAEVRIAQSRWELAEQLFQTSYEELQKRLTAQPHKATLRYDMAFLLNRYGNLKRDRGATDQAQERFREAIAHLQVALAAQPGSPRYRYLSGQVTNNLGLVHLQSRQFREAEPLHREALARLQRLHEDFPDNPIYHQEYAITHLYLFTVLSETERLSQAETMLTGAIEQMRKLHLAAPEVAQPLDDLARALTRRFRLHHQKKELPQAEVVLREVVQLRIRLTQLAPDHLDYRVDLGGARCDYGSLLRDLNRLEDSIESFAQAQQILEPLVSTKAEHPHAKRYLRNVFWNRAETLVKLQRHADALHDWDKALALTDGQAGEHRTLLVRRLQSLSRVGKAAQAAAEVEILLKEGKWRPPQIYAFASIFALAAGQEPAKKAAHAQRSVELLKLLLQNKLLGPEQLRRDASFDALRSMPDFQKVVDALDAQEIPPQP
ncbi:MAG: serine/threonine-protein kinase [Gemmataceae bacterium]